MSEFGGLQIGADGLQGMLASAGVPGLHEAFGGVAGMLHLEALLEWVAAMDRREVLDRPRNAFMDKALQYWEALPVEVRRAAVVAYELWEGDALAVLEVLVAHERREQSRR